MDNDTPSSSAAAIAMDVADALRRQSSSYPPGQFDDDELRRYIITSPQSQSGEQHNQIQQQQQSLLGMSFSNASQNTANVNAAGATTSSSLESALAALGDQGRQQLLAILQLAASGNGNSNSNSTVNAFAAPLAETSNQSTGYNNSFAQSPGVGLPANSTEYHQQQAALFGQSSTQGSSSSNSNSPNNGDGSNGTGSFNGLPNYYSNAFRQYSIHAPPPSLVGSVNQQQQQSNSGSTPASASTSSAKPSPALSAITSNSQLQHSNSSSNLHGQQQQQQRQQYQQQPVCLPAQTMHSQFSNASQTYVHNSTSMSDMNFTTQDPGFFRSPAAFNGHNNPGIPGTSSTAFYSDNGLGDDRDLLFTPLMSPALTASTQPGPSVGPLPESFANLSTATSQGSYSEKLYPNQGVAPLTVFSPLTSPALRPQGHTSSQHQSLPGSNTNSTATSPARSGNGNGNGNGMAKMRGASKNGPKTRPSPIMRPTVNTESARQHQSIATGGKSISRTSSMSSNTKRSHHAGPSPVSTSNPTPYPQHRYQSSSVPASPAFHAFNGSSGNSAANNGKPFANINMTRLHDVAQNAVQNSPSPHQFDLSGVLSGFTPLQSSTNLGNSTQQADQNPQQHSQMQQNQNRTSGASLDDLMALPAPLDLNSILNMLAQSGSYAPSTVPQQGQGFAENTGKYLSNTSAGPSTSFNAFYPNSLCVNSGYQQQQQSSQHQSTDRNDNGYLSQHTHLFGNHSAADKPAPLTPASFMNLPANQYSVLSGLLADHLPQNQQDDNMNRQTEAESGKGAPPKHQNEPTGLSARSQEVYSQQAQKQNVNPIIPKDQLYGSGPSPEEMESSIALHSTAPVSPAILAQNIKQVAAAAIAAKEAKSRSKGRGMSRRKSCSQPSHGQNGSTDSPMLAATDSKKRGKNEASTNGDGLSSPDKPFSLDDLSAAPMPNIWENSGPASTETSPMLAPQADSRKSSHKVAEQRRRDSLKLCFEELRFILPPINPDEDEDFNSGPGSRRPGENNVGGQRGKNYTVDPTHPNKGISKVALLRKSNEYVTKLHDRVDKRDAAIRMLREELRLCRIALGQGQPGNEAALDALSNVDFDDLEQDNDAIPPTYRLHGLHAPGSKLSLSANMIYRPREDTIEEDEREGDDDNDGQDGFDLDGEYKVKKVKRSSGSRANTRKSNKGTATA